MGFSNKFCGNKIYWGQWPWPVALNLWLFSLPHQIIRHDKIGVGIFFILSFLAKRAI